MYDSIYTIAFFPKRILCTTVTNILVLHLIKGWNIGKSLFIKAVIMVNHLLFSHKWKMTLEYIQKTNLLIGLSTYKCVFIMHDNTIGEEVIDYRTTWATGYLKHPSSIKIKHYNIQYISSSEAKVRTAFSWANM